DGGLIQLEIIVHRAREKTVQIGFVPDLEKPFLYFRPAIAFFPVSDQRADQVGPFSIIFWRGDIALPPEYRLCPAGEIGRHETQFYKRPDADAQQIIIQLVDILKV